MKLQDFERERTRRYGIQNTENGLRKTEIQVKFEMKELNESGQGEVFSSYFRGCTSKRVRIEQIVHSHEVCEVSPRKEPKRQAATKK